jgi:hypothetical protein
MVEAVDFGVEEVAAFVDFEAIGAREGAGLDKVGVGIKKSRAAGSTIKPPGVAS